MLRYTRKKHALRIIIILFIIIISGLFVWLAIYFQKGSFVKQPPVTLPGESESHIDTSALNGLPYEQKDIYNEFDPDILHYAYITVLPTIDDLTNKEIKFSDLNSTKDPNKLDTVEILFQTGTADGADSSIYESAIISPNATLDIKSDYTIKAIQKSFEINLSRATDAFLEQRNFSLNKSPYDYLRFSDKFCFDALNDIPNIPSLNAYFVKVYIRDLTQEGENKFIDYGLFTMVEHADEDFLISRDLNQKSNIYQVNDFYFYIYDDILPKDDPKYDEKKFEAILSINANPDHEKLIEMIEAVNDKSISMDDIFGTYFEKENYLTWMACNIILGNVDASSSNHIIFSPQNSKTWYFCPSNFQNSLYNTNITIEEYKGMPKSWYGLGMFWGNTLHQRFFTNPENVQALNRKIDYLMKNYFTQEKCKELTANYIDIFNPLVFKLPDIKHLMMSPKKVTYRTENIYDLLKYNVDAYYENLQKPTPVYISKPEIIGNSYTFSWGNAYDFQLDLIYYKVEIARDMNFKNIIYESEMLIDNLHKVSLDLEPDTYYFRILIEDENGNKQVNKEGYLDPLTGDYYNGFSSFTIKGINNLETKK